MAQFHPDPAPPPGEVSPAAGREGTDPAVRNPDAAGGHRDRRERFAGLCLSDHQPGRHGHGSDPRRVRAGASDQSQPYGRQPDQSGLRPVPVAAAWRLGLPLRVRERSRRPEQRGRADRPADPGAGWLRLGHPGGAAVPLALVPRHRLHRDAPGDAPAVAVHQPAEARTRPRTRPILACGIPIYTPATRRRTPRPAAWPRRRTPARFPSAGCFRSPMPTPRATPASRAIGSSTTRSRRHRQTWRRIPLRCSCPRRRAAAGHDGAGAQWAVDAVRVQRRLSEQRSSEPGVCLSEPGVVDLAGQQLPGEFRGTGDERRAGAAERRLAAAPRQPRAPRSGGSRCCSG